MSSEVKSSAGELRSVVGLEVPVSPSSTNRPHSFKTSSSDTEFRKSETIFTRISCKFSYIVYSIYIILLYLVGMLEFQQDTHNRDGSVMTILLGDEIR
jgi:hypothetical protein